MNNTSLIPKNTENEKTLSPITPATNTPNLNWRRVLGLALGVLVVFIIIYAAFIAPASTKNANTVATKANIVQTSAGNEILINIDNESATSLIGCTLNITITNNDGSTHTYRYDYNGAIPAGKNDTVALGKNTSYPDATSVIVEVKKNSCRWYDSDKKKYSIDENANITVTGRDNDNVRHDVYVETSEFSHPEYSNHSVSVYYYKAGELIYMNKNSSLSKNENGYVGIFDIPEGLEYDNTQVVLVSWTEQKNTTNKKDSHLSVTVFFFVNMDYLLL